MYSAKLLLELGWQEVRGFFTEAKDLMRMGWVLGKKSYSLIGVGSRLGNLWPTIGLALRIALIGLVFGLVLETRPVDYVPWLATGWAVWGMMAASINNGTASLNANKSLMLSLPMRKEVFSIEVVVRELLLLLQNSVLVIGVVLLFDPSLDWKLLLSVLGMAITAGFLVGLGWIMAPLAARYKDVGPLVSSITGVMFFLLPIMWQPERVENELVQLFLQVNPLYHYLQITRLPLLMEVPTATNYAVAFGLAMVALLIGSHAMRIQRQRIIYWV